MNDLKDFLVETAAELSLQFPQNANVIKSCKAFVERMRDFIFEYQQRIEYLRAQIEASGAGAAVSSDIANYQQQISVYQQLLEDLRKASQDDQAAHSAALSERDARIQVLEAEVANLPKKDELEQAKTQNAELLNEVEEYQTYIAELSKQINQATKRMAELQEGQDSAVKLKYELYTVKQQLAAAQDDLAEKADIIAQQNYEAAALQTCMEELKSQNTNEEALKAQMQKLEYHTNYLEVYNNNLMHQIEELSAQTTQSAEEQIKQRTQELQTEMQTLKGELEQKNADIEELEQMEQQFNELQDYVKQLTIENEKLRYTEAYALQEAERGKVLYEAANYEAVSRLEREKAEISSYVTYLLAQVEQLYEELAFKRLALENVEYEFASQGKQFYLAKKQCDELQELHDRSRQYLAELQAIRLQEQSAASNNDLLVAVAQVKELYDELTAKDAVLSYMQQTIESLYEERYQPMVSSDVMKLDDAQVEMSVLQYQNKMLLYKLVDFETQQIDAKVEQSALQLAYNKIDQLYQQNKQLVHEFQLMQREQRESAVRPAAHQQCDGCDRCTQVAQTLKYQNYRMAAQIQAYQRRQLENVRYFLLALNRIRNHIKYARDPKVLDTIDNIQQLIGQPIDTYMEPLIQSFAALQIPQRVVETDKSRPELVLMQDKLQAASELYSSQRATLQRLLEENAALRADIDRVKHESDQKEQIYETRIGRLLSESTELRLSYSAPKPEPKPYYPQQYIVQTQVQAKPLLKYSYQLDLLICLIPVLRLATAFLLQAKSLLPFDLQQVRRIQMYFVREIDRVHLFVLGSKYLSSEMSEVRRQARELEVVLSKYYK